jgi:hypothetical protein
VVPPPQSRRPGLPAPLCALLTAMLARQPEERPASYEALETALRHALDATPAAANEDDTRTQP